MTFLTAFLIQNNDIRCESNKQRGRYCGEINLYKNNRLHTILLTFEKTWTTTTEAIDAMEKVVEQVRKYDIFPNSRRKDVI